MNQAYTSKQWKYLSTKWTTLCKYAKHLNTISFSIIQQGNEPLWNITEKFADKGITTTLFDFTRSCITLNRRTNINLLGMLGLTALDFSNPSIIITEGVSDFFSIKLLNPTLNVLGITNLGGSTLVKQFLITYFSKIVIVADSDSAGVKTAISYQKFFSSHSIKSAIYIPSRKDISQEILLTNVNVESKLLKLYTNL